MHQSELLKKQKKQLITAEHHAEHHAVETSKSTLPVTTSRDKRKTYILLLL